MCAAPGTCSEGEAHDGLRAYPCRVPSARRTSSTPTGWVSCCIMARCPRCGSRRANCATNGSCRAPGPSQAGRTVAFSKIRTALKNRMHATLAKYCLSLDTDSDIFTAKWRPQLLGLLDRLPPETRRCMQQELELLEMVQGQIGRLEARIRERVRVTRTIQLIQSVPGPAEILSIVIDREMGSIDRFSCPKHFCGYAGMAPKVKGSGGKFHYGKMITSSRCSCGKQCNNYLKWAFIEAANVVVRQRHHPNWQKKYIVVLYERTRQRKGHAVAVGAMARHLAEATYWVLKKGEPYREPKSKQPARTRSTTPSRQGRTRA